MRPAFDGAAQARQVLNDAEEDLREWQPSLEEVQMQSTGMGNNMMPPDAGPGVVSPEQIQSPLSITSGEKTVAEGEHLAAATQTAA